MEKNKNAEYLSRELEKLKIKFREQDFQFSETIEKKTNTIYKYQHKIGVKKEKLFKLKTLMTDL